MKKFIDRYITKNKWKIFIILVCVPIVIYLITTVPILPTGGNNDWAGFWGGYLGAIIGGFITLYVMWKTNEDARENLEDTMLNEREKEKRREQQRFCDFLISKHSVWAGNIDDLLTKTTTYVAYAERMRKEPTRVPDVVKQEMEYMFVFAEQLKNVKSMNYELYMHFHIKKEQEEFSLSEAVELYEMFGEMHDLLNELNVKVVGENCGTDEIKLYYRHFNNYMNSITEKITDYIKAVLI